MPPKKKQLDPEVKEQQFRDWKDKDEHRLWYELHLISKDVEVISETTQDLTGNWLKYHEKLLELCSIFKCKSKIKQIEHQHVRAAFFAREDNEIEKRIVKQYIDGFYISVERADYQAGNHVKQAFSKIYRYMEDIKFLELNSENYLDEKKALQAQLNEFTKKLPIFIKKSFKIVDEKLSLALGPLKNLLEINRKLMFFDLRNTENRTRLVNDFILKAQVEEYCNCLQECQKLLIVDKDPETQKSPIIGNPNVKLIFSKLNYEGWPQNKIESFYLMPLQLAFDKMRNNLLCLMIKGINYYKAPLRLNTQFILDLNEVISAEFIAEHLLGNPVKRTQLNFTFTVLSIIFNANSQAKEFLLKKDENCIQGSVPKLIAYYTILHMRTWKDRKIADEEKAAKQEAKEKKNSNIVPAAQPVLEDNSNLAVSSYLSPEKRKQMEDEQKRRDELMKQAEELARIKLQQDQEKYGRYWIWENYCSEEMKNIFEECSELIRHVNLGVRQDIEDEIIKEGMIPKLRRQKVSENDPSQIFNQMRKRDNNDEYVKNRRPPELWNYPKIVQEKHIFRAIADPKKNYCDGRIEVIEGKIVELATELQTYRPALWETLVNRVIDALKDTYEQTPSPLEMGIASLSQGQTLGGGLQQLQQQ